MPRVWCPSDRKRIETSVLAGRFAAVTYEMRFRCAWSAVTEPPSTPAERSPTYTAVASASPIAVPPKPLKKSTSSIASETRL